MFLLCHRDAPEKNRKCRKSPPRPAPAAAACGGPRETAAISPFLDDGANTGEAGFVVGLAEIHRTADRGMHGGATQSSPKLLADGGLHQRWSGEKKPLAIGHEQRDRHSPARCHRPPRTCHDSADCEIPWLDITALLRKTRRNRRYRERHLPAAAKNSRESTRYTVAHGSQSRCSGRESLFSPSWERMRRLSPSHRWR